MAAITDPRVIAFSNNYVRRYADLLESAYNSALHIINTWNGQGLAAITPNTAAIVQDSAAPDGVDAVGGDGRTVLAGSDINNIITRATDLKNWMEGSAGISAGDGTKAVLNTISKVKVNGGAIF